MRRPHPPRTRLESDIVEADDAVRELRRAQPEASPSPRCASATASGRTCTTRHSRAARACPRSPASSASTRATSSSTRTTSSARSTTPSTNDAPGHLQRRAGRRARAERGREPARQAVRAAAAALGHGPGGQGDEPDRRPHPGRGPPAAALRARPRQPQAQAVRLPLRASRRARRCRHLRRRCGSHRCARAARRHIATSAKWRNSSAGRRASAAMSQPADATSVLAGLPAPPSRPPTISRTPCVLV